MKVLTYCGKGTKNVKMVDIPEPQVKPGLIKIRLEYAAICATDLHYVTQDIDKYAGFGLGHEGAGYIVEMGEGTEKFGFNVGDKVCMSGYTPCGVCADCVSEMDSACEHTMPMRPMITQYICCPVQQVFKLPDDADLRTCCLVEPLACCMHGMDIAKIQIGETVCLSGCGGIGLLTLLLIKRKGGTRVTVIDPVESKRKLALELGADFVIDPVNESVAERGMEITEDRGYDVVYEVSGVPSAAELCMDLLKVKGRLIYFACFPQDYEMPLNLFELYRKEASIHGVYTTNNNFVRTVNVAVTMKDELEKIIGLEMPLEKCEEAFWKFATGKYPKVIIKCQQ